MRKLKKYFLTLSVLCIGVLAFSTASLAHDDFFKPAVGEFDVATPGFERVVVSQEGSVEAFSYEGNLLSNFPVWLDGFVPVSSPVIGNVVGDGASNVMVVARNDQNVFKFFAINAQGQTVAQADLFGEIYFDPIIVPQNNAQHDDILVVSITGAVQRIRFENNQLTVTTIFQLGAAAGLSSVGTDVVVNYPESNTLEIYNEQAGIWARRSVIAVPSPVLYPVTATDDEKLFGVMRNGQLTSIVKATGSVSAGFPVNLSGTALGSVTLADVNSANAGKEVLVDFVDGSSASLRTDGTVLISQVAKKFMSLGFEAEDSLSHASYIMMSAATGSFVSEQASRFVSYLGRVRIPSVAVGSAEINLSINGTSISNAGVYSFGNLSVNDVRDVNVTIENLGESALVLNGNAVLAGSDAALFSVTTQPRAVIQGHASSTLTLHFVAQGSGVKTAQLTIASNDQDEGQYVIGLRAAVAGSNILRDGDMEAAGIDANNWRYWGVGAIFNKSNNFAISGIQSMYINSLNTNKGIQQLGVPVLAGHKYRYSIKYKLLSGTLNTYLGIHDSNADFEKKKAIIAMFSPDWQTYSREFVVPADFASDFRAISTISFGEGYLDDISIEEIPNVQSPIIYDGDMEQDGLAGWTYYGQPSALETTSQQSHSGTQSLHIISQGNFGASQVFNPIPGHQYHLSMWYRINGGTLLPRIGTVSANEDFEFRVGSPLEPMLPNTNGEWRLYERTFTAAENYAGVYRLIFAQSNADYGPPYRNLPQGEVWIDDVSIDEIAAQ